MLFRQVQHKTRSAAPAATVISARTVAMHNLPVMLVIADPFSVRIFLSAEFHLAHKLIVLESALGQRR